MRVFITGGCGFIGSNIAEHHLKKGDEVRVLDDLSTGSLNNIASFQENPHFQAEIGDLLTWKGLEDSLNWADRVYHMAAVIGIFRVLSEPIKAITSNIMGCDRILETISKIKNRPRIMLASSSSVYGQTHKTEVNEKSNLLLAAVKHPLYGYAIGKIADEAIAAAYYKQFKLPITSIRIFNTVGPRQSPNYGMVLPRFVGQACRQEPITVFGDGNQTRSFCDVRDVVVAFDMLANTPASIDEIVNVGNNSEITINDLALLVKKLAKSNSPIEHVPYLKAYGQDMTDVIKRRPNIDKLIQLTNFKHQWTLEQTISELIQRFKDDNNL